MAFILSIVLLLVTMWSVLNYTIYRERIIKDLDPTIKYYDYNRNLEPIVNLVFEEV